MILNRLNRAIEDMRSTLITSQLATIDGRIISTFDESQKRDDYLPITQWHKSVGDATLADAILDRLLHNSHKLKLKGESMRKAMSETAESITSSDTINPFALGRSGDRNHPEWVIGIAGIRRCRCRD